MSDFHVPQSKFEGLFLKSEADDALNNSKSLDDYQKNQDDDVMEDQTDH